MGLKCGYLGEHELSENIVHMVLARLEGAPRELLYVFIFSSKISENSEGNLRNKTIFK